MLPFVVSSHAQVEEHERVAWPFREVELEKLVVPQALSGLTLLAGIVARVQDVGVQTRQPPVLDAQFLGLLSERGQDLLVDAALPLKTGRLRKILTWSTWVPWPCSSKKRTGTTNPMRSSGADATARTISSPQLIGSVSSPSSHMIHLPLVSRMDSDLAVENESCQAHSRTFVPHSRDISMVRSVEPVSSTNISRKNGRALSRQSRMTRSSFLTIMQREMSASLATPRSPSSRRFSSKRIGSGPTPLSWLTKPDSTGTTTYSYDRLNRLTGQVKTGAYATFTYDRLNRRTGQQSAGACATVSYDSVGNILAKSQQGTPPLTSTYDVANRLVTSIQGSTTTSYTYDLNGNLTLENLAGVTTGFVFWGCQNRFSATTH